MSTFAQSPSSSALNAGFLDRIDSWAAEVLTLRADTIGVRDDPARWRRQLDDLFGSYKARDRLSRLAGADELLVVQALDQLFTTFTEEVGRSWLQLTGMADDAGPGWWWARLPVAGPARDDYDDAIHGQRGGENGENESLG